MTVKEAIGMLSYGTVYEVKGSYSGKTYHKSYANSKNNLEKYANREVVDTPFCSAIRIRGSIEYNQWAIGIVVIWMKDYDLCKK